MCSHFAPATKEAYYYRQIFESHFPSATAAECIPASASIACSTAKAIEWDEEFKKLVSTGDRAACRESGGEKR
jgi:asparagine synthase (glutamine-hydrolysing)